MAKFDVIQYRVVNVPRDAAMKAAIHALLRANNLVMDDGVSCFVVALTGQTLAGCAGLDGNIVKCVAVDPQWRGENVCAGLLSEIQNYSMTQGHLHLFLFTRPENRRCFQQCGFWPVAVTNHVLLMENTPRGISRYCTALTCFRHPGQVIGSVVMNANPFTLGHRYLAEYAAARCDWLHIFVVEEDASSFPFSDRLTMVQTGVAHLPNVEVHKGGAYIISRATFPSYFLKASGTTEQAWCELDLRIFRQHIAPALNITHRFVGREPFCPLTHHYNQTMFDVLNTPSIELPVIQVEEVARMTDDGEMPISASQVRRLLMQHQLDAITSLVPTTTLRHLKQNPLCFN